MWLESFLTRPPTFHTQVRIVLRSCSLQIFLRLVLTLVPLRRLILSFFNMFSSYFLPYDFLLPPAFDICLHLPLITALPHVDFPHKSPPPPTLEYREKAFYLCCCQSHISVKPGLTCAPLSRVPARNTCCEWEPRPWPRIKHQSSSSGRTCPWVGGAGLMV